MASVSELLQAVLRFRERVQSGLGGAAYPQRSPQCEMRDRDVVIGFRIGCLSSG
jgi:hypothetical protein